MADTIPPPPAGYVVQFKAAPPPPPEGYVLSAPAITGNANYKEDVPYADGTSPYTSADLSPDAMAPDRPRSVGEIAGDWKTALGRDAAMQTGSLVKGAASLPDILIAPGASLIDRGAQALGADPKYFSSGQNGVRGYVQAGLDAAGVPEPATPLERFANRTAEGLGGLAAGNALGGAMVAGQSIPTQVVGKALTENLGQQTAALTAGNTLGSVAHESGIGPGGELAATLVGSALPALGGGSFDALAAAGKRALGSVDDTTASLAARAQDLGIPLKASQVSDSRFGKVLDSVSQGIPFSGAGKFKDAQQDAFNRAVSRTFGEDAAKVTPEVFDRALTRIGSEYDRLASVTKIPLGPDLGGAITAISDEAKDFLGPQAQNLVLGIKKRLVDQSVKGVLPGEAFQSIDSALGKAASSGGENAYIMKKLQETLRDAAQSSLSPEDAQALATARAQYRDLKTIEPLVAATGTSTGNINPAALQGRVTANKVGKASMARGDRGDLGDLAAVGQRFIKEPPNSFTADRMQAMNALKMFGGALIGGGAGSVLGPLVGMGGALLTGGGAVGASRLAQRVNQSQTLIDAMLGKGRGTTGLQKGVAVSAQPTLLELMQGVGN